MEVEEVKEGTDPREATGAMGNLEPLGHRATTARVGATAVVPETEAMAALEITAATPAMVEMPWGGPSTEADFDGKAVFSMVMRRLVTAALVALAEAVVLEVRVGPAGLEVVVGKVAPGAEVVGCLVLGSLEGWEATEGIQEGVAVAEKGARLVVE